MKTKLITLSLLMAIFMVSFSISATANTKARTLASKYFQSMKTDDATTNAKVTQMRFFRLINLFVSDIKEVEESLRNNSTYIKAVGPGPASAFASDFQNLHRMANDFNLYKYRVAMQRGTLSQEAPILQRVYDDLVKRYNASLNKLIKHISMMR